MIYIAFQVFLSIIPGIDLTRLAILNLGSEVAMKDGILSALWKKLGNLSNINKSLEINLMLTLRFLCNAFSSEVGRSMIIAQKSEILSSLKNFKMSQNRNLLMALATFYLNLAVLNNDSDSTLLQAISEVSL